MRTLYLVIADLADGMTPAETARTLHLACKTPAQGRSRSRETGQAGPVARREENGQRKLQEDYMGGPYDVVRSSSLENGWQRPTRICEPLVRAMDEKTEVRSDLNTMSRTLKRISARRSRPEPTVACPWSKRAKSRSLWWSRHLLEHLPEDEVTYWEEEVDIHLSPKFSLLWMIRGRQKDVLTPAQNVKARVPHDSWTRGWLIWSGNRPQVICVRRTSAV